jgi:hypothetical protein
MIDDAVAADSEPQADIVLCGLWNKSVLKNGLNMFKNKE